MTPAPLPPTPLSQLTALIGFAVLVVAFLLVWRQSFPARIRLFALQSALLAVLAGVVGVSTRKPSLALVAVAVLVVKAWAIPRVLQRLAPALPRSVAAGRSPAGLLAAGGLVVLAYAVLLPVTRETPLPTAAGLPPALATGLIGLLLGVGAFTFHYAKGLSYFSTDPAACANCHIMQSQYDSWQKSSHHGVAGCVDCHLPHDLASKYLAKASNGYHHSKGFTLQDFHEPIRITPGNADILQESCLHCHDAMVHDLVAGAADAAVAVRCTHCHAGVGHGPRLGLGGPERTEELEGLAP